MPAPTRTDDAKQQISTAREMPAYTKTTAADGDTADDDVIGSSSSMEPGSTGAPAKLPGFKK